MRVIMITKKGVKKMELEKMGKNILEEIEKKSGKIEKTNKMKKCPFEKCDGSGWILPDKPGGSLTECECKKNERKKN